MVGNLINNMVFIFHFYQLRLQQLNSINFVQTIFLSELVVEISCSIVQLCHTSQWRNRRKNAVRPCALLSFSELQLETWNAIQLPLVVEIRETESWGGQSSCPINFYAKFFCTKYGLLRHNFIIQNKTEILLKIYSCLTSLHSSSCPNIGGVLLIP